MLGRIKDMKLRYKIGVGVATGAAIAAGGGAAFAYFTGTGTGTGSASVGNATNTITVVGTETGALFPGTSPAPSNNVSFTASNGSSFNQRLSNIHPTSITIDTASDTYTGASPAQQALWNACTLTLNSTGSAFTMADIPVGVTDGDLAGGASNATLTEKGTLVMNDTGVDQSNCEGAPLALHFTTS